MSSYQLPSAVWPVIHESNALTCATEALRGTNTYEEAALLARKALQDRPDPEDIPDYVTETALRRIAGLPGKVLSIPARQPYHAHRAELLGLAWTHWANQQNADASDLLGRQNPTHATPMSNGMNDYAMDFWSMSLHALLQGNTKDANRHWGHAIEVASLYGLEATTMIRWTFVASLLPRNENPLTH